MDSCIMRVSCQDEQGRKATPYVRCPASPSEEGQAEVRHSIRLIVQQHMHGGI